ncbi:MAG: DUF3179 domain-containing protein [Thermoanaerobaculia bacterium]|nr:DUF3179 domain-containing protein [Thermoanaerobaculia bacterium]
MLGVAILLIAASLAGGGTPRALLEPAQARDLLERLLSPDEAARGTARIGILRSKDATLLPALVDALFFASSDSRPDVVACLEGISGEKLGRSYRYWVEYIGGREALRPKEGYRAWKAALFSRIDPSFGRFLDPRLPLTIRPEEIVWGGVRKDGIPALKYPRSVQAAQARFMTDSEMVFGVSAGGQHRAYPQRILDWHEMANDALGGEPLALSYCTLCGSAVAYSTRLSGLGVLLFGSSGLLYRSNKLMYDEQTLSLWSNLSGAPVSGKLVEARIRLAALPLTYTTWQAWRESHPETTVVTPETGFTRDYTAGAAYGKYFESPETMFPVWKRDASLPPKTWIYALRQGAAARAYPLALLFRERVVNDEVGGLPVVLIADPDHRAVRAFHRKSRRLAEGPSRSVLVDPSTGELFRMTEEALLPDEPGEKLDRLPGSLAYWFGWYAQQPETTLYEGCFESGAGGR